MRGLTLAADRHTFPALLVDEDFVLITAINETLGQLTRPWSRWLFKRQKSPQSGTVRRLPVVARREFL
jgi:hypothetical protein